MAENRALDQRLMWERHRRRVYASDLERRVLDLQALKREQAEELVRLRERSRVGGGVVEAAGQVQAAAEGESGRGEHRA